MVNARILYELTKNSNCIRNMKSCNNEINKFSLQSPTDYIYLGLKKFSLVHHQLLIQVHMTINGLAICQPYLLQNIKSTPFFDLGHFNTKKVFLIAKIFDMKMTELVLFYLRNPSGVIYCNKYILNIDNLMTSQQKHGSYGPLLWSIE